MPSRLLSRTNNALQTNACNEKKTNFYLQVQAMTYTKLLKLRSASSIRNGLSLQSQLL